MTTTNTKTYALSWPAAAFLLLLMGSSTCTTAFVVPMASTASTKLKSAVAPTSSTVHNAANSTGSDNNSGSSANIPPVPPHSLFKDLHEANKALDKLANMCGDPSLEPVISRADECQSNWENMRSDSTLEPDTVSFNTVLKAWSKCCQSLADYKKQESNPAIQSTDVVPPSKETDPTASHNDHPQVYTAKDAAERVSLLLLSQEQDYETGVLPESARPDTISYNEAIGAWARSGAAEAPHNAERLLKRMLDHDYIQPDGVSYNSVVDAWAYSGKPEALQKVKQIWQHMEQIYADSDNDSNVKPTTRTVNSIIQAHGKRVQELVEARDYDGARKIARDAEEYLDLMKERYEQTGDPDHMPDIITYITLMDTYGKCGRFGSTLRAKALLDELKTVYKETQNPLLKPNVRAYTSLITAWSKTRSPDSPKNAETLLEELKQSEDPALLPNARTYTSVIQTWGRSSENTKAERALKLLQTLKEEYKMATDPVRKEELKPTIITYNAALDACARCQGDLQQQTTALKIAFAILKAVNQKDSGIEANAATYSVLLRCCCFLLQPGPERNQVATAVFEKAKKAGMADFRVLFQLRKTVDTTSLAELFEGIPQDRNGVTDFNSAPPTWSRNVR